MRLVGLPFSLRTARARGFRTGGPHRLRAHAARGSIGDKDAVSRRQFRGLQAVEDELGLDHPGAHRRGRCLRGRARNSSNACVTTAEIVRPDAAA